MRLYRQISSFSVGNGEDAKASAAAIRRWASHGAPGSPVVFSGVKVGRIGPLADRGPIDEPRARYYRAIAPDPTSGG